MNKLEIQAIIKALENGKSFEFSNYFAGVRKVLEYDQSVACFVLTAHHAYDPDVERNAYTRNEFEAFLQNNFAYKDFHLPRLKNRPE